MPTLPPCWLALGWPSVCGLAAPMLRRSSAQCLRTTTTTTSRPETVPPDALAQGAPWQQHGRRGAGGAPWTRRRAPSVGPTAPTAERRVPRPACRGTSRGRHDSLPSGFPGRARLALRAQRRSRLPAWPCAPLARGRCPRQSAAAGSSRGKQVAGQQLARLPPQPRRRARVPLRPPLKAGPASPPAPTTGRRAAAGASLSGTMPRLPMHELGKAGTAGAGARCCGRQGASGWQGLTGPQPPSLGRSRRCLRRHFRRPRRPQPRLPMGCRRTRQWAPRGAAGPGPAPTPATATEARAGTLPVGTG
mmetsp:Transcript_23427/g.88972  ORF Transcript_23427/g.88972 Transcript_23427/m.88972 type:complete len:304 (+) Transcript_23427:1018-1929(+)